MTCRPTAAASLMIKEGDGTPDTAAPTPTIVVHN